MMKKDKVLLMIFLSLWIAVTADLNQYLNDSAVFIRIEDVNEIKQSENSMIYYYSIDCTVCRETEKQLRKMISGSHTVYMADVSKVRNTEEKIDFVPLLVDCATKEKYEGKIKILEFIKKQK